MSKVCFNQDKASLVGVHPVSRLASPLRETYQEKISESEKDILKTPQNLLISIKAGKITNVLFLQTIPFHFTYIHFSTLRTFRQFWPALSEESFMNSLLRNESKDIFYK